MCAFLERGKNKEADHPPRQMRPFTDSQFGSPYRSKPMEWVDILEQELRHGGGIFVFFSLGIWGNAT